MSRLIDWTSLVCAVALAAINLGSIGVLDNTAEGATIKRKCCTGGNLQNCPVQINGCTLSPFPIPQHRQNGTCTKKCYRRCEDAPCYGVDGMGGACVTSAGCM